MHGILLNGVGAFRRDIGIGPPNPTNRRLV
jgi:hypothetical protein